MTGRSGHRSALAQWRKDAATVERIRELADAVEDAADLLTRTNREAFIDDRVLQRAAAGIVIHVGEIAKALADDLKSFYPDVDWRGATRMRNKLAHHYVGIDAEILWDTLAADLPRLAAALDLPSWARDVQLEEGP